MVKIQTKVDGYWGEGNGIHRNWISRTMISISVIRVQTLLQTGVWFCYRCSRLVSGFGISIPDRQVPESGENFALDSILVFFLAFQFFARMPKGMDVKEGSLVAQVSTSRFVESRSIQNYSDRQKKGERSGVCKNGAFFLDIIKVSSQSVQSS